MINIEKELIEEKVKQLLALKSTMQAEDMRLTDSLKDDLFLDSLDIIELSMEIQSEYKVDPEDEEIERWVTIRDVVEYLDLELNRLAI